MPFCNEKGPIGQYSANFVDNVPIGRLENSKEEYGPSSEPEKQSGTEKITAEINIKLRKYVTVINLKKESLSFSPLLPSFSLSRSFHPDIPLFRTGNRTEALKEYTAGYLHYINNVR